jgi:hypothetical protein
LIRFWCGNIRASCSARAKTENGIKKACRAENAGFAKFADIIFDASITAGNGLFYTFRQASMGGCLKPHVTYVQTG